MNLQRSMSEELGIESGDMHRIKETADLACLFIKGELSREFRREDLVKEFIDILRKRIVYGIKHELIDLVRIKKCW